MLIKGIFDFFRILCSMKYINYNNFSRCNLIYNFVVPLAYISKISFASGYKWIYRKFFRKINQGTNNITKVLLTSLAFEGESISIYATIESRLNLAYKDHLIRLFFISSPLKHLHVK